MLGDLLARKNRTSEEERAEAVAKTNETLGFLNSAAGWKFFRLRLLDYREGFFEGQFRSLRDGHIEGIDVFLSAVIPGYNGSDQLSLFIERGSGNSGVGVKVGFAKIRRGEVFVPKMWMITYAKKADLEVQRDAREKAMEMFRKEWGRSSIEMGYRLIIGQEQGSEEYPFIFYPVKDLLAEGVVKLIGEQQAKELYARFERMVKQ